MAHLCHLGPDETKRMTVRDFIVLAEWIDREQAKARR
jgi:hypothetical protein